MSIILTYHSFKVRVTIFLVVVCSPLITNNFRLFLELKSSGLEVQTHLTGEGRSRLDMVETLQSIHKDDSGSLWVYLSGPNRFIEAGEKACRALAGVDWFAARWDV